jgi:PAS domain S-box-containing protein
MSDTLNILLVDDNSDDRAVAMRELGRAFPHCQFHHAANPKDLFLAVECGGWDVVITDYHLGWSDGITVLLSVKARNPGCPVIMFTGRGNEDIAVRAMKAGLDDYVLKSPEQAGRLSAAVQMTLEQAKQHQAFDQAVLRYHSLFDDIPFGLFILARDGSIIEANAALVEMLRYSCRDALVTTNILDLLANAKKRSELRTALKRMRVVKHFETQIACCDGSTMRVDINLRPIGNSQDEEACYEGSLQDIPARKTGQKRSNERGSQFNVESVLPVEF